MLPSDAAVRDCTRGEGAAVACDTCVAGPEERREGEGAKEPEEESGD